MNSEQCIFCQIANGQIISQTIYEDKQFRVILDVGPATRGHVLILPKKHFKDLFDLDDETASKIFIVAREIAGMLRSALGCEGLNVLQNNGKAAGQTVFHFHLHLIPRYQQDSRLLSWTPLEVSAEELEEIREKITRSLSDG